MSRLYIDLEEEEDSVSIVYGACPVRKDGIHCDCWWTNLGPCCSCRDDTQDVNDDLEETQKLREKWR